MLNLASNVEKSPYTSIVNFTTFMKARIEKLSFQFSRKYPSMKSPEFIVKEYGEIRVSESLLNIVMENLLENAVNFNLYRENFKIEIGCVLVDDYYQIYVKDNGVGVSGVAKDEIFLPFRQAASQNALEITSYGIGLSIVERAIRNLGGKVWHENTRGGGATFLFTFKAI
jgi:signal transduction histidine kinase